MRSAPPVSLTAVALALGVGGARLPLPALVNAITGAVAAIFATTARTPPIAASNTG